MENDHYCPGLVALSLNTKDSIASQIILIAVTMIVYHIDTFTVIYELMPRQSPFEKCHI